MKICVKNLVLAQDLARKIPITTPDRKSILLQEFVELECKQMCTFLVDLDLPASLIDSFEPILHLLPLIEQLDKEPGLVNVKQDEYKGICGVYLPKSSTCNQCKLAAGTFKKLELRYDTKTVFLIEGPRQGIIVHGYCKGCKKSFWPSFIDSDHLSSPTRTFELHSHIFGITKSTFFSNELLRHCWDFVSIANSTFIGYEKVYNHILEEDHISRQLLQDNTLVHKTLVVLKELKCPNCAEPWTLERDISRHLDTESWCKEFYPKLKEFVNTDALDHVCHSDPGCALKWVCLDGVEKDDRPECKAEGDKVLFSGDILPAVYLRNKCHNWPNLASKLGYCKSHEENQTALLQSNPEDQYCRPLTRAFSALLPENETVVTGVGCKDIQDVTKYNDRTAGMLYAYRTCGIRLNNAEMYTHESLSQVLVFLYDTFCSAFQAILEGSMPLHLSPFRGLIYDRACDMPPFLKNLALAGNSIAKLLLTLLDFMVDIFHAKGHVKPACTLSNPLCQFHPKLPKFRHLFQPGENMNTEIAEQSFRKINKTKSTTKYMTPWRRMIFFKLLDYSANKALEKNMKKKGLLGPPEKKETVHESLSTSMTVHKYEAECDLTYSLVENVSSESSSKGTNSLCSDVNPSELSNLSLPSINIMEVDSSDSTDYFIISGDSCEDSLEYITDEEPVGACIGLDLDQEYLRGDQGSERLPREHSQSHCSS